MSFKDSTTVLKFYHNKRTYKDWKLLYWTSNVNNFNRVHAHVSEPLVSLAFWSPWLQASAYDRRCVSLRLTPKIPVAREKNLWYPGYDCSPRTSWHARWLSCCKNTCGWRARYQERLVLKIPIANLKSISGLYHSLLFHMNALWALVVFLKVSVIEVVWEPAGSGLYMIRGTRETRGKSARGAFHFLLLVCVSFTGIRNVIDK